MRTTRGLIPCRNGKGFLLVASVALAGLLASVPAHAAVSVTLDVERGESPAAVSVATHCLVNVPAGANGVAVLTAAVASGCIASFKTTTAFGGGNYLQCVNSDCEAPADDPKTHGLVTFWRLSDDGCVNHGIDDVRAAPGKKMRLSYIPTALLVLDFTATC